MRAIVLSATTALPSKRGTSLVFSRARLVGYVRGLAVQRAISAGRRLLLRATTKTVSSTETSREVRTSLHADVASCAVPIGKLAIESSYRLQKAFSGGRGLAENCICHSLSGRLSAGLTATRAKRVLSIL